MKKVRKSNIKSLLVTFILATIFFGTSNAIWGFKPLASSNNNNIVFADYEEYVLPESLPTINWVDTYSDLSTYVLQGVEEDSSFDAGTIQNPYKIATVKDLAFLRYATVNASQAVADTYKGKYFKQTEEIDLEGNLWLPIGGQSEARRFAGYYDGDGHTISNMTIRRNSAYSALFAGANNAVIKNLKLVNSYVNTSTSSYSAILVAYATNTRIENIETHGYVGSHTQADIPTTDKLGRSYRQAGFV